MMKKLIFVIIAVLPTALAAQNLPSMNQGDMQKMMQKMQEMQQCMESIDQSQLDRIQSRSEQFKKEIDALCGEGKRDQAQERAMDFAKEISSDPSMKKMQECAKLAQGAMQGAMPDMVQGFAEKDYSRHHVCDE